jgi:hypothetical protein
MNCMQGYVNDLRWSNYNQSTMRQLMVYEDGGIIGSIAPTEGTVQRINGAILNLAHDKIFIDDRFLVEIIQFRILVFKCRISFKFF